MESATETHAVKKDLQIDASPETVWEFLIDPEKATRWMGQSASFDARPGGEYRVDVIPNNIASGSFVDVDPPHRLVFTWGWEPKAGEGPNPVPPGSSTIEIELTPEGNGTRLRFVHRDLPDARAAESHSHGWDHYLGRLVVVAAGRDPGADPWVSGQMS